MGHGVYASCTDDAEETQGTHNQVRPWQVAVLLAVLFAVYRNEIFVFWPLNDNNSVCLNHIYEGTSKTS